MKRTPMYEEHVACSGNMVEFCGWELPVHYGAGIVEEHRRVRSAAGLFDVSHMGEVWISGEGAEAYLQHLVSNDVEAMHDGQVIYNIMCYPNGGAVDDLLIYRFSRMKYFLVINAANVEKDVAWMRMNLPSSGVELRNVSAETAEVALQGPAAERILQKLVPLDVASLGFFHFADQVTVDGVDVLVSRTGYTGEDGFEIYAPWESGARIWRAVMAAGKDEGLLPAGLGCRDSLRFEACLPLYGQEISPSVTPLEAGLGYFVKLDKKDFIGRSALRGMKDAGLSRKSVALEMLDKGVPRHDQEVRFDGRFVGFVTTGGYSPSLDKSIALAMVPAELAKEGAEFSIVIRDKEKRARVMAKPFYRKNYKK